MMQRAENFFILRRKPIEVNVAVCFLCFGDELFKLEIKIKFTKVIIVYRRL